MHAAIIAALLLLGYVIVTHVHLARSLRVRQRLPLPGRFPWVSVIRPIKGLDVDCEANVRAALDDGYPGRLEILFVFDDPDEPAVPIVRRAIAQATRRRVDARIVFCGAPPARRTGKLNAMIAGLASARGELIAFADSDIQPSRSALTMLVCTLLSRSDAGAAFAPVVVTAPTRTLGDAAYALMLNGLHSPVAAFVAARTGGTLPFIMGQMMLFRRNVLTALGGLAAPERQLVDDMYLGRLVEEAGYRNLVSPEAVPIIQHDLPLADFVYVYRRWMTFSPTGLPGLAFNSYSWARGAAFWAALAGVAVCLSLASPEAALIFAAAAVAMVISVSSLHARVGGHPLPIAHAWLTAALILAAPAALLLMHTQRHIEWRGRTYALAPSGRLEHGRKARPPVTV